MNSTQQPREPSRLIEDFDDFFDNSPNGYVIVSPDDRILRANARIAGWLGFTGDEFSRIPLMHLFSIGGKIYFETHLRPLLRMQGMFEEVALELVSNDGSRHPVIANALERRDDNGNPLFVRYTFIRATDRKKYEQNLRDQRSKAQEGRKAAEIDLTSERETAALREQFIAVLGHDLRNPLASIIAGMRILGKSDLDDQARTVVKLVESSASRMAGLIDNVMDFARGRLGGGIPVERRPVSLEPILSHVVDELRVSNPDRRIDATVIIPSPVLCDPGRLSQVLSNLIANAITHGSASGPIEVAASQTEERMELSVSNSGEAIPAEILDSLFEPFTREETKPSQQGLGLGLYIASEIARAHGGMLSATSSDERTRFTLSIPTG